MAVRFVLATIVRLVTGGLLGCIAGGVLTGNEVYWIALAIGAPLLLTFLGISGSRGARTARAAGQPIRQGIISTIPGVRVAPLQRAVLNPEPSAHPVGSTAAPAEATVTPVAEPVASGVEPFETSRAPLAWRLLAIVTVVLFFDSFILVSAPSAPGAPTVDRYRWQAGFARNEGPDFSQPSDLDAELFDAGGIDMGLVAGLVQRSIADARLEGLSGVYPSIRRWSGEEPRISVVLVGSYFDAYYEYSVAGELIKRSGSAFG